MSKFIVIDTEKIPYSQGTDYGSYKVILYSNGSLYEETAILTYDDYSNNYKRNMVVEYEDDHIKNKLTRIRKTIFKPETDNSLWLLKGKDDLAIRRGRFMEQLKRFTKLHFIPKSKNLNEESLASIAADMAEELYLDIDLGD